MRWQTAVFLHGIDAATTTLERWLNALEEKHCVVELNIVAIGSALVVVVGLTDAEPPLRGPRGDAETMSILASADAWRDLEQ